ncbi:MAG: YlmC/YmxH family sporulation protein [Oscillospiraceae bacterium]|nr:YlmC/YmxH family sporulation protein [Oscillospiraceae bacterium]
MQCCITELRNKDVVNKSTGARLGCVMDIQIDTCKGCVIALVVIGRSKGSGLFGREEVLVSWEDIDVIGDDIILVNNCSYLRPETPRRRSGGLEGLFR